MDRTIRCAAAALALAAVPAAAQQTLMQTWHPWQLDSVLVAWVLQQTPRPPAFESLPRGQVIPADRAIDTPDSPFRRTGQRTAFEAVVRHVDLRHPCVTRLRDAVRVVELAAWRKPEFPPIEEFEARVLRVIPSQAARGGLEPAFAEVERYCRDTASQEAR